MTAYGNRVGNARRINLTGNISGTSHRWRSWGSSTLDALVEEVDEDKGLDEAPNERWGHHGSRRSGSGGRGSEPELTDLHPLHGDDESTMLHSDSSEGEEKKMIEGPHPRSSGYSGGNTGYAFALGGGRQGIREIAHPIRYERKYFLRRSLR